MYQSRKGAKLKRLRPYVVPHVHLETSKKELQHLLELGVLEHQRTNEWASSTFIIPKKDARVRWISNLRESNECTVQKNTIPVIQRILKKRKGSAFFLQTRHFHAISYLRIR